MPETPRSRLPKVGPEQRRAAAGQFERANQVLAQGTLDYAIQLLVSCCQLDPINPVYRQKLRQAEKTRFHDNQKGRTLAFLTGLPARWRMKKAAARQDYLKVLEHGEEVFLHNPWDLGAHLAMAEAFEQLDLPELALWTLDQVRQGQPNNPRVNRPMARLFEKRGQYSQATALWELVRQADPHDREAERKHKDLAVHATIAKGKYEEAIQGRSGADASSVETIKERPKSPAPAKEDRVSRDTNMWLAKIQSNPTSPHAYLQLATLWRRTDMFEQARKVLRDGLAATGNDFELGLELIDLEIEPFRRDLAVAEAKLAKKPGDAVLQDIRARLAREVHSRELDFWRQKSDRIPSDNASRFEMGLRLLQTGQIDEAIKEFQTLRSDPRHQGKALVYLGFCFKNRGNWRLAQRNFQEAVKLLPPGEDELRKEILYQLAAGYAEVGDFQKAVDVGCELANLDFAFKDIGKRLDEWNVKV